MRPTTYDPGRSLVHVLGDNGYRIHPTPDRNDSHRRQIIDAETDTVVATLSASGAVDWLRRYGAMP